MVLPTAEVTAVMTDSDRVVPTMKRSKWLPCPPRLLMRLVKLIGDR